MKARIFSSLILWTLVFATLYFFNRTGAVVLMTVAILLTQFEFYKMLRRTDFKPNISLGLFLGLLILIAPCFPAYALFTPENILVLGVILTAAYCLMIQRDKEEGRKRFGKLSYTLLGIVLIPFMMHFMIRIFLIETPHPYTGIMLALWVIMATKLCDTGALLTGLAFGKHRMSPTISPKKTWEGLAGGLLVSALISALLVHLFPSFFPASFTPLVSALLALPVAILGVLSDLLESLIKRYAGVKDSGNTIPGIGGIFDLTDSFMLSAPGAYLLFSLIF